MRQRGVYLTESACFFGVPISFRLTNFVGCQANRQRLFAILCVWFSFIRLSSNADDELAHTHTSTRNDAFYFYFHFTIKFVASVASLLPTNKYVLLMLMLCMHTIRLFLYQMMCCVFHSKQHKCIPYACYGHGLRLSLNTKLDLRRHLKRHGQ